MTHMILEKWYFLEAGQKNGHLGGMAFGQKLTEEAKTVLPWTLILTFEAINKPMFCHV